MRCPNKKCRRQTGRLIIKFTKDGKKLEGCPECLPLGGTPKVRTGKKIWAGSEVYTQEQMQEKNHNWITGVADRAANMRRRSPLRSRGQR